MGPGTEKSNGICYTAIGHTIYTLKQCENRLRTFCSPMIWIKMCHGFIDKGRDFQLTGN
jgi:hypothetical protein